MLQALLGDDPGLVPLTQLLIARTQGNPFFLEESVRTLVETGVLVGERGAYRLAQPLDTLQVPATVQALLAARIDRLPPEDKRLLQTAAVIGTEVPWPLLQAIADTSDEALYRSLAQLQAAEFLYETSLFPERAYTFKHALTHEVAYGSLLQERRRVLHARIVEALEALAGDRLDDQVERLAQHALRGEVWEKALAYGRQAGDKAHARSAYREAVVCYEQALAALEHLPDSRAATEQAIDLRLGLRTALNALGEAPGRILDHLRRAETLAQTLGDHLRLGRVYADMGANFWVAGDVDRAIVYGQRALALAATLGHVGLQARAHLILGRAYYDAGDYPRAVESLGRNVATLQGELLYERFGTNGSVAAISRAWLSHCHAERGAFTEGLAMAEEGLRIAETVNHPFSLIERAMGSVWCICARGTCTGPSRCWSGPWVCARTGTFRSSCPGWPQPWAWRMPWMGVSPRVWRWWNKGWSKRSPGADRGLWRPWSPASARRICWLAAWKRRANAPRRRSISPASTSNAATRPGPCGSWARARRARRPQRSSPPPATTARPSPWPRNWACARSRRTATAASGTLYARTGQREQARAALSAAIDAVSRHGDDVLAAAGGGGAGTGGVTSIDFYEGLAG